MVSALTMKLWRDMAAVRGQVLTITLVVACGIAAFVTMRGNWSSLLAARDAHYDQQGFADVFAVLERAPLDVADDLAAVEGVAQVHTRVVKSARVLVGEGDPPRASVIGLDRPELPQLNRVRVTAGRQLEVDEHDAVMVLEAFATAHRIKVGQRLPTVLNGRHKNLLVVGLVMSPEYVFAMAPGAMVADPSRFGVLWMTPTALEASFDMKGAFNDVSFRLQPGASAAPVVLAIDHLLEPYGGFGAVARSKQASHHMLAGEVSQLRSIGGVVPVIFLAVAALLLNIVIGRIVQLQRPQIATLKAVGYGDRQIGLHYLQLALTIVTLGAIVGVALGTWLGSGLLKLYEQFFHLPDLRFRPSADVMLTGVALSAASAVVGALAAVRKVVSLPPAQAMRPAPPAKYRPTLLERLGVARLIGPSARMVLRELERHPWRTLLSVVGIATGVAIVVVARGMYDGMDEMLRIQFHEVMREDVTVVFERPQDDRAVRSLGRVPGVLHAEGLRSVPTRFHHAHRHRDGVVWGYPDGGELRRLYDAKGRRIELPPDGVVLTEMLGELLGVEVGDVVEMEIREGDRRRIRVTVTALTDEVFGLQGHMALGRLERALGQGGLSNMALLRVDPTAIDDVGERLLRRPAIASATRKADTIAQFESQSADMMLTMTAIMTLFGATIAVGVVYNNARVALSMRRRDLASLRVLGYTRGEISAILIGEMALQVLVAIGPGLLLGTAMTTAMLSTVDPETYRLPTVIASRTYAFATAVTLVSALVSALLVRRKLDRLDLVEVLKMRS
jgi:putative ABC transport system permease protein